MPGSTPDQPLNGSPTAAEVFRVFRNTTMASIEGLKKLLEECADLPAELVTIHSLRSDGNGDGLFSARRQNRYNLPIPTWTCPRCRFVHRHNPKLS